ncbi:ABC transporter substrate-binding protein [Martelella sp. AMO21009]
MKALTVAAAATFILASAASAETSIKFGVLTDLSGPYSDLSGEGSVVATQLAVDDFLANHPDFSIEVVKADHQNKPDVGSAIAREWFDEQGVDVIVDVASSAVGLAVSQIALDNDKLFLATGPASAAFTGKSCSPNTIQWTYDTYALSHGTGNAIVKNGGDKWFFITADYAFGHAMEGDTSGVVTAGGGEVLGSARVPLNTSDFSSYVLQAQASGANVVGLANAGGDMINSIKQASEFGLTQSGVTLAGLLTFVTDVHSLGLETAQGLQLTEAFYWDLNDDTRAWSARFEERHGSKPSQVHAGAYSAVTHYLNSVAAADSKDTSTVVAQMKTTPTEDVVFGKGYVREDGRKMHDMYLFQVKTPAESTGPWDYYKLVATIPAEEAFRPLTESDCPLIAK